MDPPAEVDPPDADSDHPPDVDAEVDAEVKCEEIDLFRDLDRPATSDKVGLTIVGVVVTMFAWIAKNKGTDSMATDMWDVLRVLLPELTCIGTFHRMQKFLRVHMLNTLEMIDVCVNSCIGYFDCQAPELIQYKHSHRTYCPVCGDARYLPGGEKKARKIFYYFPLRPWLQDLFRYTTLCITLCT